MICSFGFGQSLPLDFESTTTVYPFTDFDGGVATKIANPEVSGINTSGHVIKLVKDTGAVWAGSKITMAEPINFSAKRIFKVKVLSPVAGKKLTLKFEGASFAFEKTSSPITAANVWEELTFDFSLVATNNLNNQIVFIFDLGTKGDGSANSTFLFDDVVQELGTGPILDLPVLPLTFELQTVAYPFSDFAGGETKKLANPFPDSINPSATVMRMIKNVGETYAGSIIQMAGPIDFSKNKIVNVKVWSPVAGKKLLLKFEGSPVDFDNGAFETEATIKTAKAWEVLTFDYTSPTLFPPVNNNDNKIAFFFDFGNLGDGGLNSTYYFDDIAFSSSSPISTPEITEHSIKLYPNPSTQLLNIEAKGNIEKVIITNLMGQEVFVKTVSSNVLSLPISHLPKGIYLVSTIINGQLTCSKWMKE